MFGWEFPPKIYGGLAVASYGITKGLSLQGDIETTFCMPKPTGEEEKFLKIVNMSQVPIVWRDVQYDNIKDRIVGHTAEDYYRFRDHIYADFNYWRVLSSLISFMLTTGSPILPEYMPRLLAENHSASTYTQRISTVHAVM